MIISGDVFYNTCCSGCVFLSQEWDIGYSKGYTLTAIYILLTELVLVVKNIRRDAHTHDDYTTFLCSVRDREHAAGKWSACCLF